MPRYTRRRPQQELEGEPEQTQEQSEGQEQEQALEQEQLEEQPQEYSGDRPESINEFLRKYLRVLTRPSFAIFKQEVVNPTWRNVLVQLGILMVITLLPILAIGLPTYFSSLPNKVNPNLPIPYSIYAVVGTIIFIPLSFFAVSASAYFAGKAINGANTVAPIRLKTVTYAVALSYVPIGIIMTILSMFLGFNATLLQFYSMIFLAFSLYLTVLVFLATQALFDMNRWRTITIGAVIIVAMVFIYSFIGPLPFTILGRLLNIKG